MGRVAFVSVLAAAVWTGGFAATDAAKPKTHTVTIDAMRFRPETITVSPGDTVIWINKDLVPHTATSEAGRFDSKDIQTEKSWKYTTRKKGDFAYVCTFHPTMTGMLRVK